MSSTTVIAEEVNVHDTVPAKDYLYPAKLNALVTEKALAAAKASSDTGEPLAPEYQIVLDRVKKSGRHDVYKSQYEFAVWAFTVGSIAAVVTMPTLFSAIVLGIGMMLWHDFYSGVLHVVLDHPRHMLFPVLDEPCLEFQWHHHIPFDIAEKPFVQACGDLNLVTAICAAINLIGLGLAWSPIGRAVVGFKILNAYLGQFNHRVSHISKKHKTYATTWAQDHGLLLSNNAHRVHHQGVHDKNFCIGVGLLNPALNWFLDNICNNPTLWLLWFVFVSVVDCWCITWVIEHYGGSLMNGDESTPSYVVSVANYTVGM